MILYHGSNMKIEQIDLSRSKPNNETNIPAHDYDIVAGPIANDKVGAQIRRFIEHDISFNTFLERLKYMKGITFQYYFGTQKALDTLEYLQSKTYE
jgi:hypothetical protein